MTSLGGLPQPPSGLTATAGDGRVVLRWTASPSPSPSPDVAYWIEYRAGGGAWQRLPIPVTCRSNPVQYLVDGTTYSFRVRSTNLAGDSAPSNVVTARPVPPRPAPPAGLHASGAFNAVNLFKVTAANFWYERVASSVARATTVRGGCSAVAFTPVLKEISSSLAEARATNSTSCTGVVFNVKVTAKLWSLAFTPQWSVVASNLATWGPVPTSRYGYSTARCSPGQSVTYSPVAWLQWGTPASCGDP